MAEGTWFDNLTRALAGSGDRRSFLRLLAGSVAGAAIGTLRPETSEAAPAAQATCSQRPPVTVQSTPSLDQLSVVVTATGQGNTLQRVTFNGLRNALIDVPGVATGVGNGFSYTPPSGTTQATFTVRAVDGNGSVHAPLTVTDGCGDWRTFVGAGIGALRNPVTICASGQTALTAAASAGTTTLEVGNQGCFRVGQFIVLDPGGADQEELEVVGFGSVKTRTATTRAHPAGTTARRRAVSGDTCSTDNPDSAWCPTAGEACCPDRAGGASGKCCPPDNCCSFGCCGTGSLCCRDPDDPSRSTCLNTTNPNDCCTQFGLCPAGQRCCDLGEGQGKICHARSIFQSDVANCGTCRRDCRSTREGDNCANGECRCGPSPACNAFFGEECIGGVCCKSPNVPCRPSPNRACCMASVAYCANRGTANEICCLKTRVACGNVCCQMNQFCDGTGQCTLCGCGSDRVDAPSNSCRCGSGQPCDGTQGKECLNGTCVCAAHPGWALGKYSCTFNPSTRAWNREIVECPPGDKVCKKVAPGFPDEFWPPISCGGSCNYPYEEMQPLCIGQ